jgi:hypothetical protein
MGVAPAAGELTLRQPASSLISRLAHGFRRRNCWCGDLDTNVLEAIGHRSPNRVADPEPLSTCVTPSRPARLCAPVGEPFLENRAVNAKSQ